MAKGVSSFENQSLPHSLFTFCIKSGMPKNLTVTEQCDWIARQIENSTTLEKQVASLQNQVDSDYWPLA